MDFSVLSPTTKTELQNAIRNSKGGFRFGAGYTDLLLELKKQDKEDITVINLAQLKDKHFNNIEKLKSFFRIGALVTAESIVNHKEITRDYPVLQQAANQLASAQIRHVATIGGNICTASPSGDIAAALMALNAVCEILDIDGNTRNIPVSEFIIGLRKTALKKKEVLRSITLPLNEETKLHSGFIKVGTRRSMECSVVSLAFHLQLDKKNIIRQAGVAMGAVAPTIPFAEKACQYLIGKKMKKIGDEDKLRFAELVLNEASPITDIRATAWYREEVLFNISKSILETNE